MSTTATPELQQRLDALAIANRRRLDCHHVKSDVANGRITFDEALRDDRAQAVRVVDLMLAQHRWGPAKVNAVAHHLRLGASVRVRDLSEARLAQVGHEVAARQDRMIRQRASASASEVAA
jgi:hypothetical protein